MSVSVKYITDHNCLKDGATKSSVSYGSEKKSQGKF